MFGWPLDPTIISTIFAVSGTSSTAPHRTHSYLPSWSLIAVPLWGIHRRGVWARKVEPVVADLNQASLPQGVKPEIYSAASWFVSIDTRPWF
jgi:hypothetical protein